MINIYCDESCHLENDLSNIMVLGSISCPKSKIKHVNNRIRQIKMKHDISVHNETKWVKVAKGKLDYYKEIIDYFADCRFLKFRSLVVTDKSKLRHSAFNQDHNSFYYKMYYLLLKGKTLSNQRYNIYLDMKDTQMHERSQLLLDYLRNNSDTIISKIQPVKSNEIELMQIVDLFTGMIAYRNRELNSSLAKTELIRYAEEKLCKKLNIQTRLYEPKFNIFKWEPDYYEGRQQ